jgi:hypothetical protein
MHDVHRGGWRSGLGSLPRVAARVPRLSTQPHSLRHLELGLSAGGAGVGQRVERLAKALDVRYDLLELGRAEDRQKAEDDLGHVLEEGAGGAAHGGAAGEVGDPSNDVREQADQDGEDEPGIHKAIATSRERRDRRSKATSFGCSIFCARTFRGRPAGCAPR